MNTPALPREAVVEDILRLKRERNAVLLAHYYQTPEIQELADFVGDSLALAQAADRSKADVILFAGVHFMAETAKILDDADNVRDLDAEPARALADSGNVDVMRLDSVLSDDTKLRKAHPVPP